MLSLTDLVLAMPEGMLRADAVDGRAVVDVITDSRLAQPGCCFVAIPGTKSDGAVYVMDAVEHGAHVVIAEADTEVPPLPASVLVLRTSNARQAAALLAAAFFRPAPEHIVAVTGTGGKTSIAEFTRQLMQHAGAPAASIGTLGLRSPHATLNMQFPANNTSPEPVLLHRTLRALAAHGVQHVAMEASSHGLHQHRLDGVKLAAAAFSNFSRDHLDYHHDMDAYFAAKSRLFAALLPTDAAAILNADIPEFAALKTLCDARGIAVRSYGRAGVAYGIRALKPHPGGIHAELVLEGEPIALDLPLYGGFQIYNLLAAYGLARSCNLASAALLPQFTKIRGVRGRLERVALHPSGAAMFTDYAHTPAALENILRTLRAHTARKLWVVFGCGGDRDSGKRTPMGQVAAMYADAAVITDDNPRSEHPEIIRKAIAQGAPDARIIGDRREAIQYAARQLQAGDILVVAGKGHETTQIDGGDVRPFDDAEVIRECADDATIMDQP